MGCAHSKVDDLPAVALCRERCNFLQEAIQQRHALAKAHFAYLHSLNRIGNSIHDFIQLDHSAAQLNLPPQRKGDPVDVGTSSGKKSHHHHSHSHSHSHSNSGSHLHFPSDGDSDDSDDDDDMWHLHHSDHSSPLHDHDHDGGGVGGQAEYYTYPDNQYAFPGGGFMRMNYMKKQAGPPSIVYQQMQTPETVYFGESSSSSLPYYYQPSNQYAMSNSSSYPYYGYPNYGGGGGGGAVTGYYGSSSPQQSVASSSKPPPPPPSPPKASTWDFLNPFENYDKYYSPYTPTRDSKELREEEGIPDLEEEDLQHEVVKQVDKTNGNYSKSVMIDDEGHKGGGGGVGGGETEAPLYQSRPSVSADDDDDGAEYEVPVVEKKVVDSERAKKRGGGGGFHGGGSLGITQVAIEIKVQFERASESGTEIANFLEARKLNYESKNVSKMSVVSSQPSTSENAAALSTTDQARAAPLDIDEDITIRSRNLSSILQKLYLWEKKLYSEVKDEEKIRVKHEKNLRKLNHLDERGAEAHKVDATRTLIRSLSTKIKMAIQVVDRTSVTINKVRDEELWPQLNELIKGLTRMWKSMLECHCYQCQVIKEAKSLGSIGLGKKFSDDHLQATLQLEHELLQWTSSFTSWIGAQKGYVKALNNWLVKCLLYEPEVTADGIVPFSPGRLGAPPVFVICNQWAKSLERISEKEVIDAMRIFASSVFQLWEQDKIELRNRMMINKGLERKVKNLDREDQKIHKEIQALDKKIVLVVGDGHNLPLTGNVVYQSDTSNSSSLKGSLQRVFETMERFTTDSLKVYEDLIQRGEEERLAREPERVS